jgi:hypothetical protein
MYVYTYKRRYTSNRQPAATNDARTAIHFFQKVGRRFFFAKQLHLSRGPVAPSCCATLPLLALQENQEPIESKGIKNLLEEAQFVKEGEDKRLGGGAWRN